MNLKEECIDDSYSKRLYDMTFAVRDEFLYAYANIVLRKGIKGCCAEGGVFEGDFAAKINEAFPDRKLYLFDTFDGFDEGRKFF